MTQAYRPREPDKLEFGTKPDRLKAYFPPFTTRILPRKSPDFTASKGFEMLVRNPVVAGRRPVPSARSTPGPGRARAGPGRTWPRWAWTWVTTTYMRQSSPPASGLQEFTVSCTVAAICTQSTPLSGSCSAPHARAQATVGMRCTVGATPGMTWWNGAYTRRSLCTRCTRGRPRLCAATGSGGEPQPDRRRRQPQRVLHQRARSLPAARAAGGVHPVWARGGHVTGTWPRLYFVKHVLLICVFTEQTLFGWLKRTRGPILQDGFRAKTKRFPTYQDLVVTDESWLG